MNHYINITKRHRHTYSLISHVKSHRQGDFVSIRGWIQNIRKLKKNLFVDINDGSSCSNIQTVISKEVLHDKPNVGDCVEVSGTMDLSPQERPEVRVDHFKVIAPCNLCEGYPFTPKQNHPPEYVRQFLHLRSRVNYIASIFRIRHKTVNAIHNFMNEANFVNIHTPIITTNDCEGAGEVFTLKPDNDQLLKEMTKIGIDPNEGFFDKKVFLSVSGQLCLEAMSNGLGNTYCFGPVFRAENSKSPYHLCEFYMFETEIAFVSQLEEITSFLESLLKEITRKVIENCQEDIRNCLKQSEKDLTSTHFSWLEKKWPVITFSEVVDILTQKGECGDLILKEGLSKSQELLLTQYVDGPLFVTHWPKELKPFYMKQIPNDPEKVYAFDLLVPYVGELAGGSLRENCYDKLQNVLPDGLEWYLDLRKFGAAPTGGFGLGFERYLQFLTGIKNIRDVIPFPRYPHHCDL